MRKKYRLLAAPPGWPETLEFRVSPAGREAEGSYGIGEEFAADFSEEEEAEHIASGLLAAVVEDEAA